MSTDAITPEELLAHSAWLRRLAARLVEPASAEDLVQETWAVAVRAKPDRDRPLRPWLAEVLRNLARMRARGTARWRARIEKVRASDDVPLPTPEELLTYHQAQRMVAEEVARLDEPFRSAVLLCYGQGLEPSEIARRQSIPAGTVRWRLKRGLDEVRAKLDARCGNDRKAWRAALAPLVGRTVAGGAGGLVVLGWRGVGWKMAGALLVLAIAGVTARRWSSSRGEGEKVAVVASAANGAVVARNPPPHLIGGPPSLGALAAAAATMQGGRGDVSEALKRAADPGDAPARGNPKAPVTIVIYSEFQCPFCSRVNPTLGELQALFPDDVRFVWRNLPLPFHESAGLAAEAAMAAAEQGKFWPMHDRLFANQDRLDPVALAEHAKAIGLDVRKFQAALDSGKFRARVAADAQLAKAANINGTPAFLINGEPLMGAQPLAAFKQKVDEALARAKGLPPPPPPAAPAPVPGKPMLRGPIISPVWPPAQVTLPDALLGDRLNMHVAIGNAPMRGTAKAPVEVLYFTTLICGRCAPAAQVADGLLATYGVQIRLYAKVIPVSRPGEPGPLVAEAALAAQAAGRFWPFHDALMRGPYGERDDEKLERAARDAGLDVVELRAALYAGRYRARALEEGEALRGARIGDTAFVVDGRVADGNVALLQLIEAAITKAGHKPPPWPTGPTGKDPNGLYGLKGPPGGPIFQPPGLSQLSHRQAFAVEPRDEAWAAPIEKQLGPLITKDLRAVEPKLVDSKLECRSTLCRLTWQIGKGDPKVVAGAVNFIYAPGDGRPDGAERYLVLRAGGPGQDPPTADRTIARVKSRRSTVLYNLRTGRVEAPADLSGARLPAE
jgi:RNA polymerase sigma factor (sigma-70 family)